MWQGNPDLFQEIVSLISEAVSGSNNTRQKEIASRISALSDDPSFSCYLLTILTTPSLPLTVRQASGHTLKSVLERTPLLTPNLSYMQSKIIENLFDQSISSAISSAATTLYIVQDGWPQLLSYLSTQMQHPNTLIILDNLFEDISTHNALCYSLSDPAYSETIQHTALALLELSQSGNRKGFQVMNRLVKIMPTPVMPMLYKYLMVLISAEASNEVAEGLLSLSTSRKDLVKKHFQECANIIIQFMETEQGGLGCSFWIEFLNEADLINLYLERLLFVVLKNLRLTDYDIMMMMPDNDDFRFDKEDSEKNWSKRRENAFLLDNLAQKFGGVCFCCLKTSIEELLLNSDWILIESGLLALGALAPGSGEVLSSVLPQFLPYLIDLTKHSEKLVVAMAYWTISRFTDHISNNSVLSEYIERILQGMMQKHPIVQQASCTAFCVLITRSPDEICQSTDYILQVFSKSLSEYKGKALINLLDTIGSLADIQGPFFQSDEYVSSLFLPVFNLFSSTRTSDRLMWSLTECLCSIILAMQSCLDPFMAQLFQRSCELISLGLDSTERQFAVKGFELAGVVIENSLLPDYSGIFPLVLKGLDVADVSVRQYAAAAVGDLVYKKVSNITMIVSPLMNKLFSCLSVHDRQDDNTYSLACNNAACALSELGLSYPDTIYPHIKEIIKVLSECAHKTTVLQVRSNLMCSIGKLGNVNPAALAESLENILFTWCENIEMNQDPNDKFLSFKGMLTAVYLNIKALDNTFQYLAEAIIRYESMPEEVRLQAKRLFETLKGYIGDERWQLYVSGLHFRQILLVKFQV